MKNNTDHTNLQHLNDAELDICECDDTHCSHCLGTCLEPAVVTMYDTSRDETTQTGRRLCRGCAFELYESTGGEWQADYNRNPNEQPD